MDLIVAIVVAVAALVIGLLVGYTYRKNKRLSFLFQLDKRQVGTLL